MLRDKCVEGEGDGDWGRQKLLGGGGRRASGAVEPRRGATFLLIWGAGAGGGEGGKGPLDKELHNHTPLNDARCL